MDFYGIVGAGGFGREVMPLAQDLLVTSKSDDNWELVFVVDAPEVKVLNGWRVISIKEFIENPGEKAFNVAIADSRVRERIVNLLVGAGGAPFSVSAANSLALSGNIIGEGAIFCPFTTVTSNARIGKFFHANIYSYVAHDCVIGDYVTFAPNVQCNGRVIIEDHAYVGAGAIIRQGTDERPITIGCGAVIGMGAVVTKSVPAGATVVGSPARALVRQEGFR